MRGIWHRVFASVTRGVDMSGVLLKSSVLAICSAIFTLPYFYYLTSMASDEGRFPKDLNLWGFLFAELFLLFILCLLSAIVGLSFSKRYDLPGFGDQRHFINSIHILLGMGAAMIALWRAIRV